MTIFIWAIVHLALFSAYALFLLRVRQGLRFYENDPAGSRDEVAPSHKVSVVVPMRNEASRAAACVRSLRRQRYAEGMLEFIIVDDHSTDGTAGLAREAMRGDPRFRVLTLDGNSAAGKKAALEAGIGESAGEIILTTDADCVHGPDWVATMAAAVSSGNDLAAGPVLYDETPAFMCGVQALEFLGLMGVGAGLFGTGYPRLCNGANLAYKKEAWNRAGGFSMHRKTAGGDDHFLLHAVVYEGGGRADFVAAPGAIVRCPASPSFRAFISQRIRWASKGRLSGDARFKAFLVLLFFYLASCCAAPFIAALSPWAFVLACALFGLKIAADLSVLFPAARLFKAPIRAVDLGIAELLHPFYLVFVSLAGTIGSYEWKGRIHTATTNR